MLNEHDRRLLALANYLDDFCAPLNGLAFLQTWRHPKLHSLAEDIKRARDIRRAVGDLKDLHRTVMSRKQSCEYLAGQVSVLFPSQTFG